MSTPLTIPRAQVPLTDGAGVVSREWYRCFQVLVDRAGGVGGSATTDLEAAQFEDAGIDDLKLDVYRLADELRGLPPVVSQAIESLTTEVSALQSQVADLVKTIEGLQAGVTL